MSVTKKYAVTVDASSVEGSQTFAVFGDSIEDARRNYRNGETAGIIAEQLEVVGLDTILEIEESDHVSELSSDLIAEMDEKIKELESQLATQISASTRNNHLRVKTLEDTLKLVGEWMSDNPNIGTDGLGLTVMIEEALNNSN